MIRDLTDASFDIIFLQETLVLEDRLGDLAFIDEKYDSIGIGAIYSERAISASSGRAEVGLACLWKRDGNFKILKIILEDKLLALQMQIGSHCILLVNVYVKSDLWEVNTHNEYLEYLGQLENLMANVQFDGIYFIGDFNADPFSGRSWNNLCGFMERNLLQCLDFNCMDSSTFTFLSYGNNFSKWLDYFVGRNTKAVTATSFKVLYEVVGSDHFPLTAVIQIKEKPSHEDNRNRALEEGPCNRFIDWVNLTQSEINRIEETALSIMGNYVSKKCVRCSRLGCRNNKHLKEIDDSLALMITSVCIASEFVIKTTRKKNKLKVIPGWNRNVKDLHVKARYDFLKWMQTGKERQSEEHRNMCESRKKFKKALNDCKINELREISISVEEKFKNKDMKTFWRDVKATCNTIKRSKMIDGEAENGSIIQIFNTKFLSAGDQQQNTNAEINLLNRIRASWGSRYKMNLKISTVSLKNFIKRLNTGMGHDGIHSSFLKRVTDKFLNNIAHLINACYGHCYIPSELLKGDINPIIKNQTGNCIDSCNYRPVMQSSCFLKIIEIQVLDVLEEKVVFNVRQFGFKKGTSTTDACYILKEIVHKYTRGKGKVFTAFIDLSKAFDKVDHLILGNILLDNNLPIDIILLIMHYLRNQTARIIWNDAKGDYFNIEEGVRQGGILSPFLLKLYLNSVISAVSEMEIGCRLGFTRINILAYADDIVLIADTNENLDRLYTTLVDNLERLKLIVNRSKTKCMIFDRSRFGNNIEDITLRNDTLACVNEYKYLGHEIERNLAVTKDIECRFQQFYSQFNVVYRKFHFVSIETFIYLFNSYCMPEYGLALWIIRDILKNHMFKVFKVAYHNALKKIVGASTCHSNHDVANYCNQFLFNHYVVFLHSRYFKRVMNPNNSLIKTCLPFLKRGYLLSSLTKTLKENYEISFTD